MKPIINVEEAPTDSTASGDYFAHSMTELAGCLGAREIGANITRVPPGKAAFPFHHHHANEEHFFVLSGRGMLRYGDERYEIGPHDYIVNLPGGPTHAHQLINTGSETLVYLAISTQRVPEVVGYPDSAKTGVRPASLSGADARFLVQDVSKNEVGYWDGEDGRRVVELLNETRGE